MAAGRHNKDSDLCFRYLINNAVFVTDRLDQYPDQLPLRASGLPVP